MKSTICLSLCALLILGMAGGAQVMPDPSQIAGVPLPAPELSNGSVSVRLVRERMGNNVPDHPVTLRGADYERVGKTDGQGRAIFTGLVPGSVVRAEAVLDGETLRSQDISVPPAGGVRVALMAGLQAAAAREKAEAEALAAQPARPGIVTFGGDTRIVFEFQDDNLRAFYLLDVVNGARTPIDPGQPLVLELPSGATGAAALEGSSPLATVTGTRVNLRGPFPPGTTSVQVGYTVPWEGDAVRIEQRWPAAIDQLFVAVEKLDGLQMSSPQFSAQQDATAGGQPFIMATGGRVNAGEVLTVELSGLPNRSTRARDAGLAVAGAVLLIGLWAAFSRRPDDASRGEKQLAARREELFREIVSIDAQPPADPRSAARAQSRRTRLVAELERVLSELDGSPGDGRGAAA